MQIAPERPWMAAQAGGSFTVAMSGQSVWAWGQNDDGEVGDGTTNEVLSPVRIGTATTWWDVATDFKHTVGLRD